MSPSTALTLDQWQILFHETMAALLRAQEAVKRQVGFWGVLNGLWKASRDLKALGVSLKAMSELPDGVLSNEIIQSQIPQVRNLVASIAGLIDTAKQHHLTNRSLTAAPLGSIRIRGECLADFLDTLEMSIDPMVLKAINDGKDEIERGECETMDQLF